MKFVSVKQHRTRLHQIKMGLNQSLRSDTICVAHWNEKPDIYAMPMRGPTVYMTFLSTYDSAVAAALEPGPGVPCKSVHTPSQQPSEHRAT